MTSAHFDLFGFRSFSRKIMLGNCNPNFLVGLTVFLFSYRYVLFFCVFVFHPSLILGLSRQKFSEYCLVIIICFALCINNVRS